MSIYARARLPVFLQKGQAATRALDVRNASNGRAETTGGTYTLLDAQGNTVLSALALTVTAGAPSASVPSTFADAYTLPQHAWRERWSLEGITGEPDPTTVELEVLVCRQAPVRHVSLADLYELHSTWPRQVTAARTEPGTYLETAWNEMVGRMLGQGLLPHRTLNWWAAAIVHQYWAASLICRDFHADTGDNVWGKLADEYWKRSQEEYKLLATAKDDDEDGVADTPGQLDSAEPQLFLTDVPAYDWERS